MCFSPVPAVEGSSHVPTRRVMLFVESMEMVTTSPLTIRGSTSVDSVNTHFYK